MRVRYQAAPHPVVHFLSGWQDSNLRPPAPKAGAMTGLRYTPKNGMQIYYLIFMTMPFFQKSLEDFYGPYFSFSSVVI